MECTYRIMNPFKYIRQTMHQKPIQTIVIQGLLGRDRGKLIVVQPTTIPSYKSIWMSIIRSTVTTSVHTVVNREMNRGVGIVRALSRGVERAVKGQVLGEQSLESVLKR